MLHLPQQETASKKQTRCPLVIVRIIARLNVGGPAKHVVWLTDAAREAGFQSHLICGDVADGEEEMTQFASFHGVQPIKLAQMGREISWRDALVVWKLFRLLCKYKPDVIHTHTAKAGAVGRCAALLYRSLPRSKRPKGGKRCCIVHTYHGHVFHSYFGPAKTRFFLAIERLLARLATDRIVVISPKQFEEIHVANRIGRKSQFSVVPLGIDTGPFDNWRQQRIAFRTELNINDHQIVIGIVGRLTEIKNHELLLRAAAIYRDGLASRDSQPALFVIIGDGHLRSRLEAESRNLGLSEQVLFLGSRNDPERFYPGLDIVTLTSRNEGTPLSLIEAMANARPVAATAVGGVPDVLGPVETETEGYQQRERGLSVNPNDPQGLCEAWRRLVQDEPLRIELGRRGRRFALQHHQRSRMIENIFKLYQQT